MSKEVFFTFEECCKIAKKYDSRSEFHDKDRKCFDFSKKMGWHKDITSHIKHHIHEHRTYEEIKMEAKKYKTRMEFKNNDMARYCFAVTHGWLDDVCNHMKPVGDKYKRCIYAYEFSDGFCYVGLTYNMEMRHLQHTNGKSFSKVYEHSLKNNIPIPKPKQLTDYIDKDSAAIMEGEYLEKYKKDGWKIINVAKTGGLGYKRRMYEKEEITKEFCKKIAEKYEKPSDFPHKNQTLYRVMMKNGWRDFVYSVFDLEKIKKEAHIKIANATRGKKRAINYEKWLSERNINKAVLQFDLNGNFLKEYPSQVRAAEALGHPKSHGDIGKCCKGIAKTCIGYVWKYK